MRQRRIFVHTVVVSGTRTEVLNQNCDLPAIVNAPPIAAVLADKPVVVESLREEFRQPLQTIIVRAEGNRVVTAFEFLSPDTKVT